MIREIRNIRRFTIGTVGVPGERTFFIQIRDENSLTSLSLEKSQAQALAERLRFMVKEIRAAHPLIIVDALERDALPLDNPIEEEFRIGSMALFFDEASSHIQVDLREMATEFDDEIEDMTDTDVVRAFISPGQALNFADRTELLVASGRKPCPFCAFPIDPNGHLCPRANGYRR